RGRVGAHAARIGSAVFVEDRLVILRGAERQRRRSIRQHEERDLLTAHALLDHDGPAGLAEPTLIEAERDGTIRFLERLTDERALARCQAVGLDDQRSAQLTTEASSLPTVGEAAVARGRDAVADHELLGEHLRALETRRRLGRAEDLQSRVVEA